MTEDNLIYYLLFIIYYLFIYYLFIYYL